MALMKQCSPYTTVSIRSLYLILITASWAVLNGEENAKATTGIHSAPLSFTGVNLAGGEFYGPKVGQAPVYFKNFIYPSAEEFDYFAAKGMNVFRIPFRWETLQPDLNQPLKQAEIDRLRACVTLATGKGLMVILDP